MGHERRSAGRTVGVARTSKTPRTALISVAAGVPARSRGQGNRRSHARVEADRDDL